MNNITKFLIIEDNDDVIEAVLMLLQLRWPHAVVVSTKRGEKGITMAETESPDIVILDIGLPDISGYEVLKSIRLFSNVPILIMSVRGEETDVFKALESGADDYIIKPFRPLELLARLKALSRRQHILIPTQPMVVCGSFELNTATRILNHNGKDVKLTRTECTLLSYLMENAGKIVSLVSLAEILWGTDYPNSADSLKVYLSRLRQKIEADHSNSRYIITKVGIGYMFVKE
jgi:two-component system KDP operon response regulator KdpE